VFGICPTTNTKEPKATTMIIATAIVIMPTDLSFILLYSFSERRLLTISLSVANPAFADEFVKQLDESKELRNALFAYRLFVIISLSEPSVTVLCCILWLETHSDSHSLSRTAGHS
jgi:hypothetical protein